MKIEYMPIHLRRFCPICGREINYVADLESYQTTFDLTKVLAYPDFKNQAGILGYL